MNQELEIITKAQEDNNWLNSHFDEIQEKYEKKFIAVKDKKIIAEGSNFFKVLETLKNKKEDPALVTIEFIHEKGVTVIL